MAKKEDIADMMARYMIAGLPMPDNLYDDLMEQVCADLKKELQGGKSSPSKEAVA